MDMEVIKAVITTLNNLEVHGKDNLNRLLGCIHALESIVRPAEAAPPEPSGEERKDEADGR